MKDSRLLLTATVYQPGPASRHVFVNELLLESSNTLFFMSCQWLILR